MVTVSRTFLFNKLWLYGYKGQYLDRAFLRKRLVDVDSRWDGASGASKLSRKVVIKGPEDRGTAMSPCLGRRRYSPSSKRADIFTSFVHWWVLNISEHMSWVPYKYLWNRCYWSEKEAGNLGMDKKRWSNEFDTWPPYFYTVGTMIPGQKQGKKQEQSAGFT